jgi:hypothetical protein
MITPHLSQPDFLSKREEKGIITVGGNARRSA